MHNNEVKIIHACFSLSLLYVTLGNIKVQSACLFTVSLTQHKWDTRQTKVGCCCQKIPISRKGIKKREILHLPLDLVYSSVVVSDWSETVTSQITVDVVKTDNIQNYLQLIWKKSCQQS